MKTRSGQSVLLKYRDVYGGEGWEERVFSPILGPDGEVDFVIESIRDVTRVKNLEKMYSGVRELIDRVVQTSVSGIIAADRQGRIILMNKAAEELFGYSGYAIDDVNIEDYYPPGVAREIMRMLRSEEIGEKGKRLQPRPFTLYNAGLYDFSQLKRLPWPDWRFFALHLFQCRDDPHSVGGVPLDGYRGADDVLVFNHLQHGGVVLDPGNVALMRREGGVVWLEAPADVLAKRIGDGAGRPVLAGQGAASPGMVLAGRAPAYAAAAHRRVPTAGRSPREVAAEVVQWWSKFE